MEDDKKSLNLSILGRTYSICTDEDENVVYKAADLVDSLLRKIMQKGTVDDEKKLVVFVALQIATELAKKESEVAAFKIGINQLGSLLSKETL